MRISIIAFTKAGTSKAMALLEKLEASKNHNVMAYTLEAFAQSYPKFQVLRESLNAWTKKAFEESDALIFVGATGIAVRAIAPFVKDKQTDPAVVVLDEKGHYVIPLLSGHIGGANALSREIATYIDGTPVISTATDLNGLFAVDEWARKKQMILQDIKKAKSISAALLKGETIGIMSDFKIVGKLPKQIEVNDYLELGIYVTDKDKVEHPYLKVIPKTITLGIGCKRGTSQDAIEALVIPFLKKQNIAIEAIGKIATIDLKKNEQGLLAFKNKYNIPLIWYSSEELQRIEGEFTPSSFVKQITQVDNVCERAAVASSGGKLILTKQCLNGVTLAIARCDYSIDFIN